MCTECKYVHLEIFRVSLKEKTASGNKLRAEIKKFLLTIYFFHKLYSYSGSLHKTCEINESYDFLYTVIVFIAIFDSVGVYMLQQCCINPRNVFQKPDQKRVLSEKAYKAL